MSVIIIVVDETGIAYLEDVYFNQLLHRRKQRVRDVSTKEC
jgi:hypothetical protein